MNLFITGGGGFIGSHLKKHLALNGNFNVFAPKSSELNLTDEIAVDDFVRAHKIDTIVHLANRGGGRDTLDMTNVTEYNLRIFFNIAKQKNKVAKIISFGSGAEYGKHKPIINAREDDYKEALPLDEYGFYKAITSHYIEDCADNIIQLRLFGIYGEMENYRYKFITNAVVKNLLHLPITINQNVFFDYMYVEDLLNVVEFYIENDVRHKIYNASSGTKIDLLSLAALVNEASDFKSEISVLNEGLNNEYTSDNSLLKSEMKDKFKLTPHSEAIGKIHKYFKQNFASLDLDTIKKDPYLGKINEIWKGKK
ncbi:NAD-dependent epimerase/dehydratase family protein [uncultured Campylobacter sp.]|uniref:NAD-dependent epimerase/dehydratase family protein n=1 Tax=uncultured Campylobacter sp. TaxID=218934 RepID=UPI00260745F6|nr:NAD-dependent epimerase/dehydratase family protein [uncultured Campylobacter sp.]